MQEWAVTTRYRVKRKEENDIGKLLRKGLEKKGVYKFYTQSHPDHREKKNILKAKNSCV